MAISGAINIEHRSCSPPTSVPLSPELWREGVVKTQEVVTSRLQLLLTDSSLPDPLHLAQTHH